MSPRAAATRHDATARRFLDAAATLIDAALTTGDRVPPRLRSMKFPAALEWIRVEDVLQLARSDGGGSKKAFHQRWATREEFISDAVVYTLQFRDRDDDAYDPLTERIALLDPAALGDGVATVAADLLAYAESQPRSYVMLHLGTLLHRHARLQAAFSEHWETLRGSFVSGYSTLLGRLGLRLRPGWTTRRLDRALQAMVDGFLLQGRIHPGPDGDTADDWGHALLFAETVVAFTLGVLDLGGSGHSAREALTAGVAPARTDEPVRARSFSSSPSFSRSS